MAHRRHINRPTKQEDQQVSPGNGIKETQKHKSITTMIDDPADDDTDDSDTEQPPQKIQIMDFFKKN